MIKQRSFTAQKYQALILSCLAHALILFLAFFSKYAAVHRAEPLHPIKTKPAQVHLKNFTAPSPVPSPTVAQPVNAHQIQQSQAKNPKVKPKRPKTESRATTSDKDTVSTQTIQQKHSQQHAPQELTMADFMRAFKKAVQEEHHEAQGLSSSTKIAGPPHVQERLRMWTQHHYKKRIVEALSKAARLSSRTMDHNKTINTVVHITLPILKDGTLGDMTQFPMSGIKEVDQYLIDVFKNADFPPIPKRYNTDRFLFRLPIHISLRQGTTTYYITVS